MQTKMVLAVKAIIQFVDKYLIIQRDKNDETGANTWEFPGGKVEFGESFEDALIREVKEETNLNISVDKLLYATTFMTDPTRQVFLLAYKCSAFQDIIKLSFEHSHYLWSNKEQLSEMLAEGIKKDMDKYQAFNVL
jgi:8-oxo-dGTP diphosphatase